MHDFVLVMCDIDRLGVFGFVWFLYSSLQPYYEVWNEVLHFIRSVLYVKKKAVQGNRAMPRVFYTA